LRQADDLRERLQLALRVELCHSFHHDPLAAIVEPPDSAQGLQQGALAAERSGGDEYDAVPGRSDVYAAQMLFVRHDHERESAPLRWSSEMVNDGPAAW